MRAGLLTETVTVFSPSVEINEVGEQTTDYTAKMTIRARNIINRQQRVNDNGDVGLITSHTLEVRIFQPINDYDLIQWNGKRYRIISIEIDKPLMCKRLEIVEVNE